MIECIFTIDYEIYGNATGTVSELVYKPTRQLVSLFKKWNSTFVVFAEAVELQKIQEHRADAGIGDVSTQLRELLEDGFEIGLHLHPWWANARRENGCWRLDWTERNICALPEERIDEIVANAIRYLRDAVGVSSFSPVSFRGGLWLMQPTLSMARVLSRRGIQIDSSVFKGGRIRDLGLDYRPATKNGWFWHFSGDVNQPDPDGALLEVPIHSELVPFWKMLGGKRLGLHKRVPTGANGAPLSNRFRDFARFRYPRKLDFCRMHFDELRGVMETVLREDRDDPGTYRPVVAIGHTKDLVDFESVSKFLAYLNRKGVAVSNFKRVLERLRPQHRGALV